MKESLLCSHDLDLVVSALLLQFEFEGFLLFPPLLEFLLEFDLLQTFPLLLLLNRL